jgi:hypothetical protein
MKPKFKKYLSKNYQIFNMYWFKVCNIFNDVLISQIPKLKR